MLFLWHDVTGISWNLNPKSLEGTDAYKKSNLKSESIVHPVSHVRQITSMIYIWVLTKES